MSPAISQASQSNHSREISISPIPARSRAVWRKTYVSHVEPVSAADLFKLADEAIDVLMQGGLLFLQCTRIEGRREHLADCAVLFWIRVGRNPGMSPLDALQPGFDKRPLAL